MIVVVVLGSVGRGVDSGIKVVVRVSVVVSSCGTLVVTESSGNVVGSEVTTVGSVGLGVVSSVEVSVVVSFGTVVGSGGVLMVQ